MINYPDGRMWRIAVPIVLMILGVIAGPSVVPIVLISIVGYMAWILAMSFRETEPFILTCVALVVTVIAALYRAGLFG